MKNTFFNYLTATAFASLTLAGCASSTETSSTAMGEMNRTETSARGGYATDENGLSVLMVEKQLMLPVATISVAALPMENPMEVEDMFEDMGDTEQHSVYDLAKSSPNLSTFVQLLERANLVDDLQRVEELTLFAPTNEAFAQMPREKLETLLKAENTALLSTILQNHVLATDVSTAGLQSNSRIRVSDDSYIMIDKGMNGMTTHVGGAQILKADVEASNGRIHVIDKVILPSEDVQSGTMMR